VNGNTSPWNRQTPLGAEQVYNSGPDAVSQCYGRVVSRSPERKVKLTVE
jgi:hypothetical protein